jgi:hypothetical protein
MHICNCHIITKAYLVACCDVVTDDDQLSAASVHINEEVHVCRAGEAARGHVLATIVLQAA